ncbi:MAG TPA: extracellular solute-binding protein [Terriglobales bacterium]|nr:extracellular solute-binding protein [Terriglobales bacterium]
MEKKLRIAVRKFGPFESAIVKQWEDFESDRHSGFNIEPIGLDLIPLSETLFEQGGLKDGTWDIAFLNTDWVAAACQDKQLTDLTEFIQTNPPEDYPQGWTDSMLRLQQSNGVVAGLPYHDGPECLIYRKDLFEDPDEQRTYFAAHGVPLNPPRSWDEFRRVARFFQRPAQPLYGCVFAGYPDGHNSVYDFLLQLWTRGGSLQNKQGKFHFQTPQAASALRFYREILADLEAVHPNSESFDSVQCGEAFAKGEAAMSVNWFGFAAVAEASDASAVRSKVDIGQVPCQPPHQSASLNVYWMLSLAAGSKYPELSYEFMRHCASKRMDKLLTLEGGIGCRRSTWGDPEINRRIPFYRHLETLHANAREIPSLTSWPKINQIIDDMVRETRSGGRDVEDLLRQADERVAAVQP